MGRITAASFPTPDIVKTTNNPAAWDQLGAFAAVQAAEANEALALLDERLAVCTTHAERADAFESAYRHVAEWRHKVAAEGQWTRPNSDAEDMRAPITVGRLYRLTPTVGLREPGSPAFKMLTELEQTALRRLDGAESGRNVVRLRDGREVKGNALVFEKAHGFLPDEVKTLTAENQDREVLRRASFETLADLETLREERGGLDPHDPELRQAFSDASYFLIQGPEFKRGTDAIMRTFLVAAHTRVFDAAPVLPQGIDLDGMVRGQEAFGQVMREQLRVVPRPTNQARAPFSLGEREDDRHVSPRRTSEMGR